MKKDWVLTQDAFDKLLKWLDSDRDRAGRKYETIRLRLIKIFTCRGCSEAEDLADETINRVAAKLDTLEWEGDGDRARYFYAVAQKVYLEHLRNSKNRHGGIPFDCADETSVVIIKSDTDEIESEYACLERCLENLPINNRRLVLEYYHQERKAKIDHRKMLADELGIAVNALRIRAHRIRLTLERCMHDCLEQQPAH
jgi:DNA-directed RNA polymerase specialized sigma24 family protein